MEKKSAKSISVKPHFGVHNKDNIHVTVVNSVSVLVPDPDDESKKNEHTIEVCQIDIVEKRVNKNKDDLDKLTRLYYVKKDKKLAKLFSMKNFDMDIYINRTDHPIELEDFDYIEFPYLSELKSTFISTRFFKKAKESGLVPKEGRSKYKQSVLNALSEKLEKCLGNTTSSVDTATKEATTEATETVKNIIPCNLKEIINSLKKEYSSVHLEELVETVVTKAFKLAKYPKPEEPKIDEQSIKDAEAFNKIASIVYQRAFRPNSYKEIEEKSEEKLQVPDEVKQEVSDETQQETTLFNEATESVEESVEQKCEAQVENVELEQKDSSEQKIELFNNNSTVSKENNNSIKLFSNLTVSDQGKPTEKIDITRIPDKLLRRFIYEMQQGMPKNKANIASYNYSIYIGTCNAMGIYYINDLGEGGIDKFQEIGALYNLAKFYIKDIYNYSYLSNIPYEEIMVPNYKYVVSNNLETFIVAPMVKTFQLNPKYHIRTVMDFIVDKGSQIPPAVQEIIQRNKEKRLLKQQKELSNGNSFVQEV